MTLLLSGNDGNLTTSSRLMPSTLPHYSLTLKFERLALLFISRVSLIIISTGIEDILKT